MTNRFSHGQPYINPIVEARRPRQREVRRLPEHLRHDQHHDEVRQEYILIDRTTIQEFFGWSEALTWNDVYTLVQREYGWPTTVLDRSISSNGGIRLHVWAGKLPSPVVHFRECRIRLPILEYAPRAEAYFIEHACAQSEMREGPATNKCPLCGSHLFGYPMMDHTIQDCPFADLNTEQRLEFMAVNHFAWCPCCGSRSPNHVSPSCHEWPFCGRCSEWGHNHVQDMCDGHPLGLPTKESRDMVDALVTQYRRQFYERIQHNLRHAPPQRRLKYRLHLDHTFYRLFRERARHQDVHGWGPYADVDRRFADAPLSRYANHNRNGQTSQYNALVVPEFDTRNMPKLPEFLADEHRYLEQIAKIVSDLRDNVPQNTLHLPDDLPEALRPARRAVPPYPARHPLQRPLQHPRDERDDRNPTLERQQHAPSAHRSQSLDQTPRAPPKAEGSYLRATGLEHKSWADIKNEEAQRNMEPTSSSRPSHSQPTVVVKDAYTQQPLHYVRAQNPHNVPSASDTVVEATSCHATSEEESDEEEEYANSNGSNLSGNSYARDRSSPEDARDDRSRNRPMRLLDGDGQAPAEKKLVAKALALCQAPLPVEDAPARSLFQHESFEQLNGDLPSDRVALIVRIRALQIVLTGQAQMQSDTLEKHTDEMLYGYARSLQDVGTALKTEQILIVQLEMESRERILEKAEGGSDVTRIPSIELWLDPKVAAFVEQISRKRRRRAASFLNKFGSSREWVPESHFIEGHDDPPLIEDMRRIVELKKLPKPDPGYAYVAPTSLLKDAITLTRPIASNAALRQRIRYLQWLLTGIDPSPIPQETDGKFTLFEYKDMLSGVVKATLHGRLRGHAFSVSTMQCIRSMADAANGRHQIVFPAWGLWKQYDPNNWFAWMDTVLEALIKTAAEEGPEDICLCHRE